MFYDFNNSSDDYIKMNLLKACVVPRPIAWISTKSPENIVNIAPYSYFNAIQDDPPVVMFSSSAKNKDGDIKDTLRNIMISKQFVINMVSKDMFSKMKITSETLDYNISEVDKAGIEMLPSKILDIPRVKDSPISMECELVDIIELPENLSKKGYKIVFGRVLGINVADEIISGNKICIEKIDILARLGYKNYTSILDTNIFE